MSAKGTYVQVLEQVGNTAEQVNRTIQALLERIPIADCVRPVLEYTLGGPGKRVRSVLALWCCQVVSGHINHAAQMAAAAIEMVHTYSLVHDDLPAMDNDDLRRGRPTCHKAFDEASAILAGDALVTMAFEVIATEVADPALAVSLIKELARAAGPDGMIAGQLADLQAERTSGGLDALEYIHVNKTAKVFRCATRMGGLCGGADRDQLDALGRFGQALGLVFQITDDLLDVAGSSEQLGKTAGKDQQAGKLTYPAVVGMDRSVEIARRLTQEAVEGLEAFGQRAEQLRMLAWAMLDRTR